MKASWTKKFTILIPDLEKSNVSEVFNSLQYCIMRYATRHSSSSCVAQGDRYKAGTYQWHLTCSRSTCGFRKRPNPCTYSKRVKISTHFTVPMRFLRLLGKFDRNAKGLINFKIVKHEQHCWKSINNITITIIIIIIFILNFPRAAPSCALLRAWGF